MGDGTLFDLLPGTQAVGVVAFLLTAVDGPGVQVGIDLGHITLQQVYFWVSWCSEG